MNPNTGAIAHFETPEDAEDAGHTLPLAKSQAVKLMPMSRNERVNWAKAIQKRRARNRAAKKARAKNR